MPRTQAGLAEALGVDVDTLQGWESGRRPLANMRAGALLGLCRRLPALGADATLVQWLDAAMDADRIIAAGLGEDVGGPHPLAGWVHTRDTAHMVAWALDGTAPSALAGRLPRPRRGPVVAAPRLALVDRAAFFDHLRSATEDAARQGETGALLHRQALYLASYDRAPDAAAWTAHTLHRRRDVFARRGWSPHWAEARSTATALARLGDPQPLLDFIDRALADDDTAEAANLNYWALWLGALPVPQPDDAFMRDRDLSGWDPVTLLRGLTRGLHLAPGYVDLYAHSLWALLTAFPWLPQASGQLAGLLRERTSQLLDEVPLSARARRELARVHYVFDHNR
ncbi:XRE family transcriptional regulator [Streptomyces sp. NPDC019937]|uniref:helix-turn-helix domain-containing protein n=1 Tax=Streptomyces sp. NPDC019937 TaxID=3154787 RepID=UPI0033ED859D